jgi:hypothetical protein
MFFRRQSDRSQVAPTATFPAPLERVEWGGIWAGYALAVGMAVLLTFLVLGIGLSSVNPMDVNSWASVAGGAAVWSGIVILIAVFIGAWVAGSAPAGSRGHGILRGVTLWGLVMITAVTMFGWLATHAVAMAARVAPAAAEIAQNLPPVGAGTLPPPAELRNHVASAIEGSGVHVSNGVIDEVAARLNAGDHAGADSALARAANIPPTRADTILNQVAVPASGTNTNPAASPSQNLAKGAAEGVKTAAWAGFWMALLTLCAAVLGGAIGGGGLGDLRGRRSV